MQNLPYLSRGRALFSQHFYCLYFPCAQSRDGRILILYLHRIDIIQKNRMMMMMVMMMGIDTLMYRQKEKVTLRVMSIP